MKKPRFRTVLLSIFLCAIAALICYMLLFPSGQERKAVESFVPIRDDALAARYRPLIDCPNEHGPLLALYYRAAKDGEGFIHIAYHPLWARERNEAPGPGPFLSRSLYTGGLGLQRLMYGKGDIESIALTIEGSSGVIRRIEYETAENYSPARFSVAHKVVVVEGPRALPPRFKVVSWNHLFSLEEPGPSATGAPEPPLSYFSPALWDEYSMVKHPETPLRRDRAHYAWEEGVDR